MRGAYQQSSLGFTELLPNGRNRPRPVNVPIRGEQGDVFDKSGGSDDAINGIVRILFGQFERLQGNIARDGKHTEMVFDFGENRLGIGL